MGSGWVKSFLDNVREELWSYFALSGLLFLNMGIVLMVYALKRATPQPTTVEVMGIGLIVLGVLATLTSWHVHRQHRQRKPVCACPFWCCGDPNKLTNEEEVITAMATHNLPTRSTIKQCDKNQNKSEFTIRAFTTIEFQTYEQFTHGDMHQSQAQIPTKEATPRGSQPKPDCQRHKKQVHPTGIPSVAGFLNAGYTHRTDQSPRLTEIANVSPS